MINDKLALSILARILDSLTCSFTKKLSYYDGLAGLADVYLSAYILTDKDEYMISAIEKVKILLLAENFISAEQDNKGFEFGGLGREYIYKKTYETLIKKGKLAWINF